MKVSILKKPYRVDAAPQLPLARLLFRDVRLSWLWLPLRLYIGYVWLSAGLTKLTGYSFSLDAPVKPAPGGAWVFNAHTGDALRHFLLGALQKAGGEHASVQGWYAALLHGFVLPQAEIFTYLVTFGEVLVGLGLIFGCFTGLAALFGLFMNLNYLFAGTISINPTLAIAAVLLILAWRVAGYLGGDRILLPLLLPRIGLDKIPQSGWRAREHKLAWADRS
ncbi:DoxX family membrane protein [Ktedonospora formicarum]|uniref:DoxX family protein n=1 Tax=Ktedonospora formicarum TaxID=2778364 RepID=A0A8J3I150_9CHLR|nr:DoxX family membrane protein [Ktedonospora formicarum]GHO48092.1 hypothetical protein KSX_62550 [Ktedonospora formicarum]